MPGEDAQVNKSLFLEYLNLTLTCDLNHDDHLGSHTPTSLLSSNVIRDTTLTSSRMIGQTWNYNGS
jgi:hypothetical protein